LGGGQVYSFQEIVHNWRRPNAVVPLQYTLRVIGYTHVIVIPTTVMETVVLPTVPKKDLPRLLSPAEDQQTTPPPPIDAGPKIGADMLEFLTENRLVHGTATMVINLDHRTRCYDCVRA